MWTRTFHSLYHITVHTRLGIPIRFDWSFIVFISVFAFIVGWEFDRMTQLMAQMLGDVGNGLNRITAISRTWLFGIVVAIGLVISILVHELGHALVARRLGYHIDSIRLWVFGGYATFREYPDQWRHEFVIVGAGPFMSIIIALVCFGLFAIVPPRFGYLSLTFGYLGVFNLVIAGFNLLPAFPLDGGRLLRALLNRRLTHPQATLVVTANGRMIAFLTAIIGILFYWFLLPIAIFFYIGARRETRRALLKGAFGHVRVGAVEPVDNIPDPVPPDTPARDLRPIIHRDPVGGIPVVSDDEFVGVITPASFRTALTSRSDNTPAASLTDPDVVLIATTADIVEALVRFQHYSVEFLVVVDETGDYVSLITPAELQRTFDEIVANRSAPEREAPHVGHGTTDL